MPRHYAQIEGIQRLFFHKQTLSETWQEAIFGQERTLGKIYR
jgi:hypothetical protein